MATVPLSGTNIRLLSGVPFSNDYKHTRWFDDLTTQTNYFLEKTVVHSMLNANFQRIEGKLYISVNKSIDALWGANYLMFQNAQYNSKWFYCFITKLEYVNKETTYVHFQLDVFQSWKFDMNFKPSYVLREHQTLWNPDGSPVLNTVDEGLHYGSEYETVSVQKYQPYEGLFFLVMVAKSMMHGTETIKIKPTLNGAPQPLSYYIHPFRLDGTSPNITIDGSPFPISNILGVLQSVCTQDDAVNNLVSLYVTDYIGYNGTYDGTTLALDGVTFEQARIADNNNLNMNTMYVKQMSAYTTRSTSLGNKYDGFDSVSESKLRMYPYNVIILDDFKGNRTVLKPEYIKRNTLDINVKGSLGVSNKVSYGVSDYLFNHGIDNGLQASLEHALINNSPNDVPILNDYLSAYLQGNRNSLENQKNTLQFNAVMDLANGFAGGVANAGMGNIGGVFGSAMGTVQGLGNTAFQLEGLNAKKADISNTPPSLSKMGSNTAFDFGNNYSGLYVIKKQITSEYRKKLTDYFKMFGYKINEVKVPNFHTRQHFNFVQTKSCMITGNFNNDDLLELKAIFDNGITLWHTDDVGNYSLENGVI